MLWIKKTLQNHVIVKYDTYLTLYKLTSFPRAPWLLKHWAQEELGHLLESKPTAPQLKGTCNRKESKVHSQFGHEHHHLTAALWSTQTGQLIWAGIENTLKNRFSSIFCKCLERWSRMVMNGMISESTDRFEGFHLPSVWREHSYN